MVQWDTLLSVFIGIGFEGAHSVSTLFIALSIFGLFFLLSICCGFLICAPGHVLDLYCILVHLSLLMYLRWCLAA